jgi:hypothetical protein
LYDKLAVTNPRVELALRGVAGGREVRVDGFGIGAQHPAGAPLGGCDFVYQSGFDFSSWLVVLVISATGVFEFLDALGCQHERFVDGGSRADLARFAGVVRVGRRESATPHEILYLERMNTLLILA